MTSYTFRGLEDMFAIGRPKRRRPRPSTYPCDNCGRRRIVRAWTESPGVEADLCRECAAAEGVAWDDLS